MARKNKTPTPVPKSVQIQLAWLFGAESTEAHKTQRRPAEWKATLQKILRELDRYIQTNVDTDELHSSIIATGLFAARESLKEDDFWPGYAEGITRALLALLGDYPDHRSRRGGSKPNDHYLLNLHRSLHYAQHTEQRFRTLLDAGVFGVPGLSAPPRDVLNEFRRQFGSKPTHVQFLRWYKKHFPADYTAVFS
jgi:hypothetical protein